VAVERPAASSCASAVIIGASVVHDGSVHSVVHDGSVHSVVHDRSVHSVVHGEYGHSVVDIYNIYIYIIKN